MTTKNPGGKISGKLALTCESQYDAEEGDPVMITGDYEVDIADGTKPIVGFVRKPNKERVGSTFPDHVTPGDVSVEALGVCVHTTNRTGAPFDAGVEVGVGADGNIYALASAGTPTNEVQTATQGGSGLTSFTLTYDGQTTASLDDEATAAQVKTAIEALSNIGAGDISVVRSGSVGSYVYTITFGGTMAGTNVAALTATPTGGTGTVTIATATAGAGTTLASCGVALTACAVAGDTVDILGR